MYEYTHESRIRARSHEKIHIYIYKRIRLCIANIPIGPLGRIYMDVDRYMHARKSFVYPRLIAPAIFYSLPRERAFYNPLSRASVITGFFFPLEYILCASYIYSCSVLCIMIM